MIEILAIAALLSGQPSTAAPVQAAVGSAAVTEASGGARTFGPVGVFDPDTAIVATDETPGPSGPHISIGLTHTEETFTSARSSWREDLVSVRLDAAGVAARQMSHGRRDSRSTVIAFEGGRAERFGQQQGFGGFDFYKTVVGRTFGNLRIRFAPHAIVIPEFDVILEATTATPNGWEGSAGYRLMRFKHSSVGVYSVAGARYFRSWYFRGRISAIPVAGSWGSSVVVSARRYFGSSDNVVELVVTNGREVVTGSADVVLDVRQSVSGQIRGEYFLTRAIGVHGGTSYTRDAGLTRWGIVFGLRSRW